MITSALITQCRREFGDMPRTTRRKVNADGTATLFNLGNFPIMENSYSIYVANSAKTETTHYTIDLDTGDLTILSTPSAGQEVKADFKFATWRDRNWVEAINGSIEWLNARGFFKQVVRNKTIMRLSANITEYSGPSACIDLYEVLESNDSTISGTFQKLATNWSYQQDANKIILGGKPSSANRLAISYLRNLQTYSATSATLDVLTDWLELIKKKSEAIFYRSLAGKIARQGHANIDEGHFSFTNLRAMAKDLDDDAEKLAIRKKPTRPAKDIGWVIEGGGVA